MTDSCGRFLRASAGPVTEEYERRIFGKTASLFAGSAEMGAVIGGAPENDIQALRGYGSDLGMAFQIVDDVLDLREGPQPARQTCWTRPDSGDRHPADNPLCLRTLSRSVSAMTRLDGLFSGED